MRFQFTIYDRDNVAHSIEEPIGWDGSALAITRDLDKHGLMFDYSAADYIYQRKSAGLIRGEYEVYGAQGQMTLKIEEMCAGGWEVLYTGKFVFLSYSRVAGDDCYVKCDVEEDSQLMVFRNRIDQKVDLLTTNDFDGNALSAYAGLGETINLPCKSILVKDYSTNAANIVATIPNDNFDNSSGAPLREATILVPTFESIGIAEIGGYVHPIGTGAVTGEYDSQWNYPASLNVTDWIELPYGVYNGFAPWSYINKIPLFQMSPIVNYDESLGKIFGNLPFTGLTLSINLSGTVNAASLLDGLDSVCFYLGILRDGKTNPDWISTNPAVWCGISGIYQTRATSSGDLFLASTFSINQTISNITLNRGDQIFLFARVGILQDNGSATHPAFFITWNSGSSFSLSGLSVIPDTPAKVFLVNEAWSRVVEAITDSNIRMYSSYYGRTDSEPYPVDQDGCASRKAITNGLFIRQIEKIRPAQPPQLNLSINDLWNGLNPIDNLGMGFEDDPFRPGYQLLRIESWKYFYSTDVVLECIGVNTVKTDSRQDRHYSKYKFGFNKWEAEEYNGIDEFLTEREYRTELKETNNTLEKVSSFIASPFAWEITRRKGNLTSEDWRYDNETFVVCLDRDGTDLIVEQGNIDSPTNIIDPATFYNYRMSPIRIAMKWLAIVFQSYRQISNTNKIIFTDGTGNYHASGELLTSFCKVENGVIAENDYLTEDALDVPADARPINFAEVVTYTFPMNLAGYNAVKAKPRGLIYYESIDGESGYGWVEKLLYKPEAGVADFTLIPKRP